ncbi:unnamed protein product [Angiostrongylus costaricensis]|uniref:Uncharacterized protein n=1 Tax=Angiostrongylus costaricensis TaxID=334426 RepID=A0A0R3PXT5_ANGCS|nr:unnamed protein product [Angiostrongylus costaricensis]
MNQCSWTNTVDVENVDAVDSSTVACSEEQFFSGVIDGVEYVASSRLAEADNVVPYLSRLHDQVFYQDRDASVCAL